MNLLAQDWLVSLGVGVGVFAFSLVSVEKILTWLHEKSLGSREYVLNKFELMFIENTQTKVTYTMLLISFGFGGIVFLLCWPNLWLGSILGALITYLGWQIPKIIVDLLYQIRCKKFVAQLVDGLTIMNNGIRSGLSINQSMERVTENLGNPIKQEFEHCLSQTKLGLSLEEALANLAKRIPEPDVQILIMSISILNQTGGDLASTFRTISETIRERQKILSKIDALTSQGKTQGMIMAVVPFLLLGVFSLTDSAYIKPLFNSTLGIIFLIIMVGLQMMGGYFMKKIATIKV